MFCIVAFAICNLFLLAPTCFFYCCELLLARYLVINIIVLSSGQNLPRLKFENVSILKMFLQASNTRILRCFCKTFTYSYEKPINSTLSMPLLYVKEQLQAERFKKSFCFKTHWFDSTMRPAVHRFACGCSGARHVCAFGTALWRA